MPQETLSLKDRACIIGVGETRIGKVPGTTPVGLEMEAVRLALEDAGLKKSDLDGVLAMPDPGCPEAAHAFQMAIRMGLRPRYCTDIDTLGAGMVSMAIHAAMAVSFGLANYVVCTFAVSNASGEGWPRGAAGGDGADYTEPFGHIAAVGGYAMAARRHMHEYGTRPQQLGAIAVAARKHALMNDNAQMKKPMALEDYLNSRWICEPFRLFDCSLVSDGGGAFIVTTPERARNLKHRPAYIMGVGAFYPHDRRMINPGSLTTLGSKPASDQAYRMAGITPKDIDFAELYDAFTYTTLVTLEDYGFCQKGEGGSFVESGRIELGGELPVNTHGGLLSQGHVDGINHIVEAVRQLRGQCGPRQVPDAEIGIVSGQGGNLSTHNTMILRR